MYDDRAPLTGVKLAVLSLMRHSPNLKVIAFVPNASAEFISWSSRLDNLEIRRSRDSITGAGWNVKPSVILRIFDEGHDEVIWLDSDIIVCGDLDARLQSIDPESIVATEEYFWGHRQGDAQRTTGLGLTPARTFRATINSGLLRFSKVHRPAVEHWAAILASKEYEAVQQLSAAERPIHYWADQETLTGLLGSDLYADMNVVQLKRGVDVAQCFGPSGFTIKERLRTGKNLPLLVHAIGVKPWSERVPRRRVRPVEMVIGYFQAVHLELTPYVAAAQDYRGSLEEDVSWMSASTFLGRALYRLYPDQPALRELPLAIVDSTQRWIRRSLGIGRIGTKAAPVPRLGRQLRKLSLPARILEIESKLRRVLRMMPGGDGR